jgi:hypothetical protein
MSLSSIYKIILRLSFIYKEIEVDFQLSCCCRKLFWYFHRVDGWVGGWDFSRVMIKQYSASKAAAWLSLAELGNAECCFQSQNHKLMKISASADGGPRYRV